MKAPTKSTAMEFSEAGADPRPLKLPGTTKLHDVCLALGWDAIDKNLVHTVVLWGWVGTGKTLFPRSLFQALNYAGLKYSLVTVDCARLACLPVSEAVEIVERVEVVSAEVAPLLLAVSHADLLGGVGEALGRLCNWVTNFCRGAQDKAALVFLITSRPDELHPQIADQVNFRVYFDLPDEEHIPEILEYLAVPQYDAVAQELCAIWRMNGGSRFTARGLLNAVNYWKTTTVHDATESKTSREIAEALAAACVTVPRAEIDSFRSQAKRLLEQSSDFFELWDGRFLKWFDPKSKRVLEMPRQTLVQLSS